MKDKKESLVILDLDETLIHSRRSPLDRSPDILLEPLSIYVRPYAKDLIEAIDRNFQIGVWSAGSPLYVDTVVQQMFPESISPLFVWNRDHCTQKLEFFPFQILFLKDLNKTKEFGFDLSRVIIIEDDPVKVRHFSENALIVERYFGEDDDDHLNNLVDFFKELNGEDHN